MRSINCHPLLASHTLHAHFPVVSSAPGLLQNPASPPWWRGWHSLAPTITHCLLETRHLLPGCPASGVTVGGRPRTCPLVGWGFDHDSKYEWMSDRSKGGSDRHRRSIAIASGRHDGRIRHASGALEGRKGRGKGPSAPRWRGADRKVRERCSWQVDGGQSTLRPTQCKMYRTKNDQNATKTGLNRNTDP